MTRSDIEYAVNRLSTYVHNPSENCMLGLKHLIRCISRTKSASLFFSSQGISNLTASTDSSWDNITQSKSTSGILFLVNDTLVAGYSNKKNVTAQSTREAKYAALAELVVTAQWPRSLYDELFLVKNSPITEIDNTAALVTTNSTKIPARNRQFLMRQETVRETIENRIIKLKHTPTNDCKANSLT